MGPQIKSLGNTGLRYQIIKATVFFYDMSFCNVDQYQTDSSPDPSLVWNIHLIQYKRIILFICFTKKKSFVSPPQFTWLCPHTNYCMLLVLRNLLCSPCLPLVSDSQTGAAGGGPVGRLDSKHSRFPSSLPTYLPVQCQLNGTDSAFFLREANQEVVRNGSLSSRTEPFFLHRLEPGIAAPRNLPSVNCSYGNLSTEQPIPVELLQSPLPHVLQTTNLVTLNWKIKGQVVVPKVGPARPWIQVSRYFYF